MEGGVVLPPEGGVALPVLPPSEGGVAFPVEGGVLVPVLPPPEGGVVCPVEGGVGFPGCRGPVLKKSPKKSPKLDAENVPFDGFVLASLEVPVTGETAPHAAAVSSRVGKSRSFFIKHTSDAGRCRLRLERS